MYNVVAIETVAADAINKKIQIATLFSNIFLLLCRRDRRLIIISDRKS